VLSGCGSGREKGLKPSPDWSRSVRLGDSVTGSVSILAEEDTQNIHLAWLYSEEGESKIRLVWLDSKAEAIADRQLDLPSAQLRMPRLAPAGDGNLHLFWASRTSARQLWQLWHVLLSPQGELAGSPQPISDPEANVKEYAAAPLPGGSAAVIWAISGSNDLYGLHISPQAVIEGQPVIVSPGGAPDIKADSQGGLHLSWVSDGSIYYAALPEGRLVPVEGTAVAMIPLFTGDSLAGPSLGLSEGWVYLLWSIQSQSGLAAGTARTEYVSFPLDSPAAASPQSVWILPAEEQPNQPYQGAFNLTYLSPPASSYTSTDFIYQPTAAAGQRRELAAAFAFRQEYRQSANIQIAVGIFEDGRFQGYEVASKTKAFSSDPVLAADQAGGLHLTWRQGASGRQIFYATTAPEARAELERLTFSDFIEAFLSGGIESFVGLLFFPWIGFGWLLPGLLVVGIRKAIRDYDHLAGSRASQLVLLLAIVIYQAIKLITLPSIAFYVPFSAWIEVPATARGPLLVGVPLIILAAAFAVAEYVRRRKADSALLFYFCFGATDALLTLAIYGVVLLGVQ
jgi:hypothetical protein